MVENWSLSVSLADLTLLQQSTAMIVNKDEVSQPHPPFLQ
jgi:hypothetical protein